MDMSKILSGQELVSRGVTKTNATLPDSGQKEMTPNGTWLENKQIQSALDARRHLLEVERIEKLGSLSIAIWRDELRVAEVMKKAGSHWQYIGHNVGKHLYLRPEETLYLMEINSLLLKHNEVVVSLQKAYTLCLTDIDIAQYKVYASLSRLGYRLFRYTENTSQRYPGITPHDTQECLNDNEISIGDKLNVINSEANKNCVLSPSNKPGNLNISTDSEISQNMTNISEASSNDVDSQTNSCSSQVTNVDDRNTQSIDEYKGVVVVIKGSEESDKLKSAVNSSEIHQKSGKEIVSCESNERGVIILGNNSKNTENSECMDVDVEVNNTGQMPNTALDTDNATYLKVHTTTTEEGSRGKDREHQSTVIVNTKNIENSAGESKNPKANITTVIVNTKNATNSYATRDKNDVAANEARSSACDNSSREPSSNCTDVIYSVDGSGVVRICDPNDPGQVEHGTDQYCRQGESASDVGLNGGMDNLDLYLMHKMQKLQARQNRTNDAHKNNDSEKILLPDCYDKKVVTAKSPHVEYLPRNIFLMKTTYLLDLEGIKRTNSKNRKDSTTESSDGDGGEPRRLSVTGPVGRNPSVHEAPPRPRLMLLSPPMYPAFPTYYPPPAWGPSALRHYMRPRYTRPLLPHVNCARPRYYVNDARNKGNPRFKSYHLRVIKKLVDKFKLVYAPSHVNDLVRLVNTFNEQYDESYRLTDDFKLLDANEAREVIVLEEGEPTPKKARPNDDNEKINRHLETLKTLARKLRDLEAKKLATSRHRRVLSNAIKTFNKYFDADIYLNSDFEMIDSKLITLDSSSDSDSVVAVEPTKTKKLRNPFSVMKRRNEINDGASTSRGVLAGQQTSSQSRESPAPHDGGEGIFKYFHSAWVPGEDDFGRPEVKSREEAHFFESIEAEYRHVYYKYHTRCFESWLDLKLAVMAQARDRLRARRERAALDAAALGDRLQPLVGPHCAGTAGVMDKLQVIAATTADACDASAGHVHIDFDVYYGNSPHFRKANRPKPNFRVICVDVSSQAPSRRQLYARCGDEVPLMFAAVGEGSVSYVQATHTRTPVYVPDHMY